MSLVGKSLNEAANILAYKDVYAVGSRIMFGSGDFSPYAIGRDEQAILGPIKPQDVEVAFSGTLYDKDSTATVAKSTYTTLLIGTTNLSKKMNDRARLVMASNSWLDLPDSLKANDKVGRLTDFSHDLSYDESKATTSESVSLSTGKDSGLLGGQVLLSSSEWNNNDATLRVSRTRLSPPSKEAAYMQHHQQSNQHYFAVEGTGTTGVKASLGNATSLWDDVYAVNTSISTSDERYKVIEDIPQEWINAATAIKPIRYQWKGEVARFEAGERNEPRWHIGYGAQSVFKALEDAGVTDPWECAFMCKDTLTTKNEDGDVIPLVDESGQQVERWGIRQVELNTLKLASL